MLSPDLFSPSGSAPGSLRAALVGYGLAGKVFHAPLIGATGGLVLATVVSGDAAKVHADLPGVTVVRDISEALEDPSIDLVVIATPDHLHAPQALAALAAGKHVVIDKPFAPTLAEAREVVARATDGDRIVSIFQNRRWDADFLTLTRLLAEDALGDIVQFESHFDRLRPVSTDRWKDRRDGGLWQDLGPHLVDQALHLFGMPDTVFADIATQRPGAVAPDYAHVLLRYPHLRVILHMTQSIHASGLRFAVHGTGASYIKHGLDPQEDQSKAGMQPDDPRWGLDPRDGVLTSQDAKGLVHECAIDSERGNYPAFYAGVRDAIGRRGANPVPAFDVLGVMTVLDAARASARERREIRL
jgi:predicted dehydrogenase